MVRSADPPPRPSPFTGPDVPGWARQFVPAYWVNNPDAPGEYRPSSDLPPWPRLYLAYASWGKRCAEWLRRHPGDLSPPEVVEAVNAHPGLPAELHRQAHRARVGSEPRYVPAHPELPPWK